MYFHPITLKIHKQHNFDLFPTLFLFRSHLLSVLFMLIHLAIVRWRRQLLIPFQQQLEHLLRRGETTIGREENINIRRLQFPIISSQRFHQFLQCASLHKTHPHCFPFQVGDFIIRILKTKKKTVIIKVFLFGSK